MEYNINLTNSHGATEQDLQQGILWIIKGFFYPCWSGNFYRQAIKKKAVIAVLFLFLFAFAQSTITTIRVVQAMNLVGNEIKLAYESGEIPSIIIEDGVAQVDPNEPYISSDNRQFIGIDTTGRIQRINTRVYSVGFLLTETEIHFVNEDGYRIIPLADLHTTFGNPIVLDQSQVVNIWSTAALVIDLLAFIGLFFWNSLVRLALIALLGWVAWGIVSAKEKRVNFSPILITGIYATVPTTYLHLVLNRIGLSFCGFNVILQIIIWAIAFSRATSPENVDWDTMIGPTGP
jgi:hypothetical protein